MAGRQQGGDVVVAEIEQNAAAVPGEENGPGPAAGRRATPTGKERGMLGAVLRTAIVIGCCAVAIGGAGRAGAGGEAPGGADGTPAPGVRATTFTAGTSSGSIAISAPGPTEVTVREITIEPGGSTGWHTHRGDLLAVVQAGTLTRQLADCTEVTTPAGQAFVEPGGPEHVHVGRNLGTEPVVLYVMYVLPAGSPLAEEAPDPGCGR